MAEQSFEQLLTGGHPNSLGNTVAVVDTVLAQPARLAELFACYGSADAVVRLRTSNALKRVAAVEPAWLVPFIDRLLGEVAQLHQPSAQWTLAQLCATLRPMMTPEQHARAVEVLKGNLERSDDWIVLSQTMQTLADWSAEDAALRDWLRPQLERLSRDARTSVAGRAKKLLARRA